MKNDHRAARFRRPSFGKAECAVAVVVMLGIAGWLAPHQARSAILYNDSASVPLGFWVETHRPVTRGAVVAFQAPPAAMGYVEAHLPEYAHGTLIIKYVVAISGDTICRTPAGAFSVNGRTLGTAAFMDEHGNRLPTWQGCSRLASGAIAVFSNRIPNSFDSRYYGAIPAGDLRGVYRPLWVW